MKKTTNRFISLALGVLMIFMSFPTLATPFTEPSIANQTEVLEEEKISSTEIAQSSNTKIKEISALREEHVKHFQMPDGTMQAIVFPNAVHEKDSSGAWQAMDSSVYLKESHDIKRYVSKDGQKQFSATVTPQQPLYTIAENGYRIAVSVDNTLNYNISQLKADAKQAIVMTATSKPHTEWDSIEAAISSAVSKSTVIYPSAYPNIDIEYTIFGNAIKENIVLKSVSCGGTYKFKYHLEGLKAILNENGSISFLDVKTDEPRYRIPAPYMYDQNGEISRDVYYTLNEESDGSYLISIIANEAWLKDTARAYPIKIDPTLYSNSKVNDTFVNAGAPNTSYGDWGVWISPNYTGFIQAIMPSLPLGATITRGSLNIYYYYNSGVTGNRTIAAYQMNAPWDEINTTYNTLFNNYGSSLGISSTLLSTARATASSSITENNPRKLSFNVTNAVRAWYNGSLNYGIALKHRGDNLQSSTGSNTGTIIRNYEAFSDHTAYFSIIYELPSGVYAIKKHGSSVYVKNNTVDSLAWVFQEPLTSLSLNEANRDYLFKLAYRPETDDYVIRSMSNNEIIIYPSLDYNKPLAGKRVVSGSPATDSNLPSLYTWKITPSLGYDQIWYSDGTTKYYLCSPSDESATRLTLTTDATDAKTRWDFQRYTGEELNGTVQLSYSDELLVGETYDFDMGMYSSTVGRNGPIAYSVTEPDYSPTDRASINSQSGVLTALKGGLVRVCWTYAGAPYIWSRLVTICGNRNLISVKNASNNKYITPLTSYIDSNIIADEFSHSNTTMMWHFEYNGDGYYKIKNFATGYYLKAPPNNTDGASVTESSYSSTYSLWKLERTADGYYMIQSKNQYERTTSSPLYLTTNGNNVVQSNVYNTNKWVVFPYEFDLALNVYYDQAFNVRYEDGKSLIEEFESEMRSLLWRTANIRLVFNSPLQIASTPDTCKTYRNLTINSTTINTMCPANPSIASPNCAYHNYNLSNGKSCENCTSRLQIYHDFIEEHPGSDTTTSILFTGNKLYNDAGNQCNRSYLWYNHGICIQNLQSNYSEYKLEVFPFIIHEIAHSIGAPDHYHEGNPCKNEGLCIECHPETGRPTWCIMSDGWLYAPYNEESLWCDGCYKEVILHLILHHNG